MMEFGRVLTIGMTTILAGMRYVVVCHPLKAKQIVTMNRAKIAIGILLTTCVTLFAPILASGGKFSSGVDIYLHVYQFIITGFLPFIAMLFSNIKIIIAFWKQRSANIRIHKSEDNTSHITATVMVIVFIFLLSQTTWIIYETLRVNFRLPINETLFTEFSYLLLPFNSSVNFLVYFCFRKQFRQNLKKVCCKCVKSTNPVMGQAATIPLS